MNRIHLWPSIYSPLLITLANQTPEALVVLDKKFNIIIFNNSAEKLFSFPADKAINAPFKSVFNASGVKDFITPLKNKFLSTTMIDIPSIINNKKINWKAQTINNNNTIFHFLTTIGMEEKDKLNEIFRLETLIEHMPCNVYWMDRHIQMVGCNQNVLTMLNMTREQFYGKTYEELSTLCHWPDGLSDRLKNDDLSVLHTGIPIIAKEDPPLPHSDGSFSNFLTSRVPLYNNDGEIIGVAGISTEVSPLKEARRKAEAANLAKTEFIANMSHDIRTPLTGVIGLSELLEHTLENPEQKEEAHLLHDSGEELLSMLNGILDAVQAGNLSEEDIREEEFDLYQCIQDLVKLELPTTKLHHLGLEVAIDFNVPRYIISDYTKIHRILLNLLGNAIKFTKIGYIKIEIKCLESLDNLAHLQFSVADTGIGIPKDKQAKVFERFFRASPSYKGIYTGHGLGLHIAQSYVNLLGGHITLTSEENVGTTFSFDLRCKIGLNNNQEPLITETPIAEPIISQSGKAKPSPNIPDLSYKDLPHVLLIEDHATALKVIESMAKNVGFLFTSTNNGEHALELAKEIPFDLILTDIGLPNISGYDFTLKLREWENAQQKTETPVIGLTGHVSETAKKKCLECGMNDVLTKPINLESLLMIKKRWAKNKKSVPQPVAQDTEIGNTLIALDAYPLLDDKLALELMGNDIALLSNMLHEFATIEIPKDLIQIQEAHALHNWELIEQLAHKMKGGAVYCGTTKMKHACAALELHPKYPPTDQLERLYQKIIEVIKETQQCIEEWLKKNLS